MVQLYTHLTGRGTALPVHWAVLGAVLGAEAAETIPKGSPIGKLFMSLARDEIVFLETGNSSWAFAAVDAGNWNSLISSRAL